MERLSIDKFTPQKDLKRIFKDTREFDIISIDDINGLVFPSKLKCRAIVIKDCKRGLLKIPEGMIVTEIFAAVNSDIILPKKITILTKKLGLIRCTIASIPNTPSYRFFDIFGMESCNIYAFPDKYTMTGILDLTGSTVEIMPKTLNVGSLKLEKFKSKTLPNNVVVAKGLILIDVDTKKTMTDWFVGGDCTISGYLFSWPKNLTVVGDLKLVGFKIKTISRSVMVGGIVVGHDGKIIELPNEMIYNGNS